MRHDLEQFLLAYVQAANITEGPALPHRESQIEDADQESDDWYRYLSHDEAASQIGRPAGSTSRHTHSE